MWRPERKDIKVIWNENHSRQAQIQGIQPYVAQSTGSQQMVLISEMIAFLLFPLLLLCIRLILRNRELEVECDELRKENTWIKEQLRRFNYEKYVGKSQQVEGQLVMPEIAGMPVQEQPSDIEQAPVIKVPAHVRKKRGKSFPNLAAGLLEEEIEEFYPESCTCPDCLRQMEKIGINRERRMLTIVPAQLKIIHQVAYAYACPSCKKNSVENLKVAVGALPEPLIPGSFGSAALVSHFACEKYLMCSPLYRLEKYFYIKGGIKLSRQTMDNMLFAAAELLKPVWERLGYWFKQSKVGHADETPLLCLSTDERDGEKKKGYVFVYRSGRFEPVQVVFYKFYPGRKKKYYTEFIRDYDGYLITDGYQIYHNNPEFEDVIIVGCWQHAQKKFVDAAKFGRDNASDPTSPAMQALGFFKAFFAAEAAIKDLPPEERLKERQSSVKPIAVALKNWLDRMKPFVLPKSLLGIAVNYALNQWEYMERIFENGLIDATNNRAENAVKDFVMTRKNFLFVIVEKGGEMTSIFCSLIASAFANMLDPEKYITWVLDNIKLIDRRNPEEVDKVMPWMAPDSVKIPAAIKAAKSEPDPADKPVAQAI